MYFAGKKGAVTECCIEFPQTRREIHVSDEYASSELVDFTCLNSSENFLQLSNCNYVKTET